MNQLQIFSNAEFGNVRVVIIDGEPYFVGKDVATALGYKEPEKAVREHVPDKYKGVSVLDTPGGKQQVTVINEAGMYKLVMRSRLPNAEKFSDWTCEEVLPSIRKTGVYVNPAAPINPDFLRRLADELEQRDKKITVLSNQVAELTPKATYYDVILNCKDVVSISKIAKDYGMSGKAFNRLLSKLAVQFYQGGIWLLYQKYAKLGWTQTKTHTYIVDGVTHCRVHTYWTQKGRLGLYDLLKANGYLPTVEWDF